MGTRSEIRFYENKKLKRCIYHHYDGYPDHIIKDLSVLGGKNPEKLMEELSKSHGTQNTKCAYGEKSEKNQEDIDYSYRLFYNKSKKIRGFQPDPQLNKIEVLRCEWDNINGKKCERKIFEGTVQEALKKKWN